MLKFVIGKPASGKTYEAVKIIKNLCDEEKDSLFLVPEQFTFENERLLLKNLGDKASLYNSVLSFTRLCDEVGRTAGGIAGTILSESDKIIFMSRALKNRANELNLWKKYTSSVTFAKTMLDTVGEFKINAILPEDIRETAENTSNATLRLKLLDIAVIYEEYNALLGESFIDPADRLSKLYNTLENTKFFAGKTVIIDSFKGFTGQQFMILERIIAQADDVFVCFTDNKENGNQYSIFANIRIALEKIKGIAKKYGVEISETLYLTDSHFKSNGIKILENFLACDKVETIEDSSVKLVSCKNMFDEAEFVARTIRKLVRVEGYRYRDFVIIARDSDVYTEAVTSACRRNGVSIFYDKRVPLTAFPGAAAVIAAINALKFDTEEILKFHKTGLGTLSQEEISVLQNYCIIWNIDGELWLKDWDMNPSGFTADDYHKVDSSVSLEYLNSLRVRAITPILNLRKSFVGTAESRVRAIVSCIKECDFPLKLSKLSDKFVSNGLVFTGEVIKSAYDELINILDSLARCYGNSDVTDVRFSESLNMAISLSSVGVIPQMLDQVTFGSADRIRPSRPSVAFVLGANQGVFPKNMGNNGIFNLNERKILLEKGLTIADNSIYSAIDEEFLVYCNLCCPSDKLYISFSTLSIAGETLEPASFVYGINEKLGVEYNYEPQENINLTNAPETPESAFSEYCRRSKSEQDKHNICLSLEESLYMEKIENMKLNSAKKVHNISPEISKKLFGENIRMSASKFDTFSHCRFSYFCRYGLGVEELQSAEFNVMQRGTIIHYVLESLINEFKGHFKDLATADLDTLTDTYINNYLDNVPGYRTIQDTRLDFLISRLSRSLKEVVAHITNEILQSDFEPKQCELRIGKNGKIDTLKFPYYGGNVEITGSIDRVDEYNGYIRIIDYKSGKRTFALSDILVGLNMQMLIYLYAVTRGDNKPDNVAAGILYQPSKRNLKNEGIAMNGLLIEDGDIAHAMDKEGNGEFAPKLVYTQKGTLNAYCTSYIPSEDFTAIFDYIEKIMKKTGEKIATGDFAVSPVDGKSSSACKYCNFSDICGVEEGDICKSPVLKNSEVIATISRGDNDGI